MGINEGVSSFTAVREKINVANAICVLSDTNKTNVLKAHGDG